MYDQCFLQYSTFANLALCEDRNSKPHEEFFAFESEPNESVAEECYILVLFVTVDALCMAGRSKQMHATLSRLCRVGKCIYASGKFVASPTETPLRMRQCEKCSAEGKPPQMR